MVVLGFWVPFLLLSSFSSCFFLLLASGGLWGVYRVYPCLGEREREKKKRERGGGE